MDHPLTPEDTKYLETKALAHSSVGLVVFDYCDEKMTIHYLSDGFYRMLNDTRENRLRFTGDKAVNSVYSEDKPGIVDAIKESIANGVTLDCRYRILNGKGDYIWIGLRADHEKISSDTERFYGTYYDADQLLKERKETREILENVPAGLSLFTLTNDSIEMRYANPRFYTVHHWDKTYWNERKANALLLVHPNDRSVFHERMVHLRNGDYHEGALTYRALGTEGKYHWVSSRFNFAFKDGEYPTFYVSSVDIDARILAEREKERISKMYEAATEDMKLIVWDYDQFSHRVIMANRGYSGKLCEKYKIPFVIENVPDSLIPYVNVADREAFLKCYKALEEGENEAYVEFRFRLPTQNAEQYERMSLRKIYDSEGDFLGIFGSGQNITALRVEQEKYENALAALQGPQYYASFRLNLTKNLCWNGFLGKSEKTNVNISSLGGSGTADGYFTAFRNVIDSEEVQADFDKRFTRSSLLDSFSRGAPAVSIDYPFMYKNGERHWRRGTVSLMRNPSSGDIEGVAYSTDIDPAKRSEFLLKDLSKKHFDYVAILHQLDDTFEFLSKSEEVTFGEIGQRIPYSKCLDYVEDSYRDTDGKPLSRQKLLINAITKRLTKHGSYSASFDVLHKGVRKVFQLRYTWFEKAGGDILVVRSDITEAYRKEKALIKKMNKAKNEAEAANKAKSEFLSQMSHDIRTPLNGIIGLNYLLSEMDLPQEAKDNLAKMDASSKFLLSLVNDILDLSKAESGKLELHPEPYPVEEFSQYIEAVASPLFRSRYQSFSFKSGVILKDRSPKLDHLRINQIVFNLLSNASKYTPEGGKITYYVTERPLPDFKMAMHVEVEDNGIGMSEEFQAHLFEPFHQENGSDKAEMRGTGLGLAITKKLVDAMGGKIYVRSELGKGSVFSLDFVLDCDSPEKTNEKDGSHNNNIDLTRLKGKHILLCEDNAINQEIAQTILREKGILVTIAMDGNDGLRKFEQSSYGYYSLILMDLRMPKMGGLEATKAIRQVQRPDAKSIPIIAMTADAFGDDIKRCEEAGMNGHLAKPVEPEKLFEVLLKYIL
jgi:signal transduction histidine kinase/PAS domain-containing protein/ActR/RegA family two-component response regulator